MKRVKIVGLLLSILIATILIIPGCQGETETKTLDIALIGPLTGPPANVAANFQRAVEMAIEDQGTVTIGGTEYELNLVVRDDKFDPALAKSATDEMVFNQQVKVIFGPSQVEVPAMQQTTNENKVILFGMSADPSIAGTDYPYNFFVGGIPTQMYSTVYDYVQETYPQAKTVVSFYADLPDAPNWLNASEVMAPMYGLEVVGHELFPMGTSDFAPFAQKLIAYDTDIIELSGGGGATGALQGTVVKQIREAGFTGIIVQPTVPPPGIMDTIPQEYLNKIVTNDINIDSSIVTATYRNLVNRYVQKYGEKPIDFLGQAYNGAFAFLQFLDGQEDMDTERWMNEFAEYEWTGVFGEDAKWVGNPMFGIDRTLLTNFWASEWKDGELETDFVATLPLEIWISQ